MAKNRGIYLLDKLHSEILGAKLPSNEQVLSVFLYHHFDLNKQIKDSASIVTQQLQDYWDRARIPTQRKDKIKNKVIQIYEDWKILKSNRYRKTEKHIIREDVFKSNLNNLFDIARADALQLMRNNEDKEFLLSQREPGRRGVMGGVDLTLARQEARTQARKEAFSKRREAQEVEAIASTSHVEMESSSSCSSQSDSNESISSVESPKIASKTARVKNIWTSSLTAALDRTGTTDRNALFIVTETVKALGHNPAELNISRSTLKRHREKHREKQWKIFKEIFKTKGNRYVIHWDGKLLPCLLDKTESVDRLPVLVTDILSGETQLLGVPSLASGTGENQAIAVYEVLQEWGLHDKIAGFCFDTTPSNTGHRSGACVRLEKLLGQSVLNLACRHHIYELVLGSVFFSLSESASGPDIQLFRKFQKSWKNIDKLNYETGWNFEEFRFLLAEEKNILVKFAQSKLAINKYRHDYREFLELALIFLGVSIPDFSFKKPGAFHHARWLAKIIYCLKIWMFRKQLPSLTKQEVLCVKHVSIFAILIYMKSWFSATDAACAPRIDLETILKLRSYHDVQIREIAARKLENHLWYLSEELVGFSLFDKNVSVETKQAIVHEMERYSDEENEDIPKRIQLQSSFLPPLEKFATPISKRLFKILGLDTSFLHLDPNVWENNEAYLEAKRIVSNIPVVNDVAERGIALIEKFIGNHTKKETQFQYLLGVVAEHRKLFPSTSKASLTTGLH